MPTAQHPDTLDDLLRDAQVLNSEYANHQTPTTQAILEAARIARTRKSTSRRRGRPLPAPPTCRPEHEQAHHELNLAATLVLNTPQAAARLSHMAQDPFPDPEAALLFACLLHLAGRDHAARFWWKFGAGGGNPTAAYCLYLEHRTHAEYRDAEHWLNQSIRLRDEPWPSTTPRTDHPALPAHELRELLAQCHQGHSPHLPQPIEGAINQLATTHLDPHISELSQPSTHLVSALTSCT